MGSASEGVCGSMRPNDIADLAQALVSGKTDEPSWRPFVHGLERLLESATGPMEASGGEKSADPDELAHRRRVADVLVRVLAAVLQPEQLRKSQRAVQLAVEGVIKAKGMDSPAAGCLAEANRFLQICNPEASDVTSAWTAIHTAVDLAPDVEAVTKAAVEVRTLFVGVACQHVGYQSRGSLSLYASQATSAIKSTPIEEAKLFHAFRSVFGGIPGAFESGNALKKRQPPAQVPHNLPCSRATRVQLDALINHLNSPGGDVEGVRALTKIVAEPAEWEAGSGEDVQLLKIVVLCASKTMARFESDLSCQENCIEFILDLLRQRNYVLGIFAPTWTVQGADLTPLLDSKSAPQFASVIENAARRAQRHGWHYMLDIAYRLLARTIPMKLTSRIVGGGASECEAVLSEIFSACRWHLSRCDSYASIDPSEREWGRKVLHAMSAGKTSTAAVLPAEGVGLHWVQKELLSEYQDRLTEASRISDGHFRELSRHMEQDRYLRTLLIGLLGDVKHDVLEPSRCFMDPVQLYAIFCALFDLASSDMLSPDTLQYVAKFCLDEKVHVRSENVAVRSYCLGAVMLSAQRKTLKWQPAFLDKTVGKLLSFAHDFSGADYRWAPVVEPILTTLLDLFPESARFGAHSRAVYDLAAMVEARHAVFSDETLLGWQANEALRQARAILRRSGVQRR
mmetsp:Transcript_67020/g.169235  ORF Transcript_67020/g.169235 Transcript_67020/m.169235 type:complete len:682 (+) Transcript_67020:92-2137(+)